MIDNEIYDLTQTGDEVQAILNNAQGMPTPQQLSDAFALKANASDVYTKNETYTKTEVNRLVGSPDQNYVTVEDYASLPATGSTDTIYRVANYDGENEQVDVTMYSEYAWNGTSYTLLCVKSQIGEVFDISDYNDATYADLSAALGADGANVPPSIRRGGMSIKFIRSSDNKYVQYRLMSDTWSVDTEDWAIADEGVYVDNPEFVYVKTDAENKILWAIRTDGDIFYGAGVPQQVINYVNEKIAELSLDEYEDIVAFLNGLEEGDKTLQTLLNEKVDKEEGKSLIDADYASAKSTIENPEFLEVTTDSEDKILEGIQPDGTKIIGGDLKILGNMEVSGVSYKVIENPEYLAAWVDAEYKVIFGFKTDGKIYVGDADFLDDIDNIKDFLQNITDKNIDWDTLSSITAVENPEFIEAKTDSEGNLLAGRTPDGAAFENVGFSTPKINVGEATIMDVEDQEERIEACIDNASKLISYRDKDGVQHEKVGLDTPQLNVSENLNVEGDVSLSNKAKETLTTIMREEGFNTNIDLSDIFALEIPAPTKRTPIVNFIMDTLPTPSNDNLEGYMEYYDYEGNYFKKSVTVGVQGQTSRIYAAQGGMGNYSFKFNKVVPPGGGKKKRPSLKIGDWVSQTGFHLKGFADDVTKARADGAYKLYESIVNGLDARPNRVLRKDESLTTVNHASGNIFTDYGDDALCHPDGFPCELYLNGEYWGLYLFNLKKDAANYSMDEDDGSSIFIDMDDDNNVQYGHIGMQGVWCGDEKWPIMEFRNPGTMIAMDGEEIDYDVTPFPEPIDETSEAWDETDSDMVNTRKAKRIVSGYTDDNNVRHLGFSEKYQAVLDLMYVEDENGAYKKLHGDYVPYASSDGNITRYNEAVDLSAAKSLFNEYFDVKACEALLLLQVLINNPDCINKNTLWGTYKDGKITCFPYDLDQSFGGSVLAVSGATNPSCTLITNGNNKGYFLSTCSPLRLLWMLYEQEIKDDYAYLRQNDYISNNVLSSIVSYFVKMIGTAAYNKYFKEWKPAGYRANKTNTEYWEEVGVISNDSSIDVWTENTNASVGDIVKLGFGTNYTNVSMRYRCIKANSGVCPVTSFYERFPIVGGWYESPKRIIKWFDGQLSLVDNYMEYN